MTSIEKNRLRTKNTRLFCKKESDNSEDKRKLRLKVLRNQKFTKSYHPLKRKKVKLSSLKFAFINKKCVRFRQVKKQNTYLTETIVVNWLISLGIEIKQVSSPPSTHYFLKNKICVFNSVLVFANRKRIDMGLPPFKMEDFL